jgi:hypothetical protein
MSYSMAIDPSVSKDVSKAAIPLATDVDTTFQDLVKRRTEVVINWAAATAVTVGPGMAQTVLSKVYFPPVSMVAMMFKYWTGDFVVCVEVISSPLVRWRLGVVIVPPTVTAPVTFPVDGSMQTTIIESVGTTCTEIVVPYLYKNQFQEWKELGVPSINDTRIMYFPLIDSTGPAVTPVVPKVNLWMWAGPNFSCGQPDLANTNNYTITTQGKANGAEAVGQFGEVIDDLILLTHRSTLLYEMKMPASFLPILPLIPLPVNQTLTSTTIPGIFFNSFKYTYASWLGQCYLGQTGSMGMRFFPLSNLSSSAVLVSGPNEPGDTPPATNTGLYLDQSSRGTAVVNNYTQPMMEVLVPDRAYNDFTYPIAWDTGERMECVEYRSVGLAVNSVIMVYSFTGDDFRLGGFMAVPALSPRANYL